MPGATTSASDPTRIEVVTSVQRRRRWFLSEKLRGMTVSYIARKYGMAPSPLFRVREARNPFAPKIRSSQRRKCASSTARSGNWNAC
jgi:hypothetical protein